MNLWNKKFLGVMGLIYAYCATTSCFSSSTETSLGDLPRPILHKIVNMAGADKSLRLVSRKVADRYELGGILNFPENFGSKQEDLSCDIPHPKGIRVLDLTKISNLTPLGLKTGTDAGVCESLSKLLAKPDHTIGCLVVSSGTDPKTIRDDLGLEVIQMMPILNRPCVDLTLRQKFLVGRLFNSHRLEGYRWFGEDLPMGAEFVLFAKRLESFFKDRPIALREMLCCISDPRLISDFFIYLGRNPHYQTVIEELSNLSVGSLKEAISCQHYRDQETIFKELSMLNEENAVQMIRMLAVYFPYYAPSQLAEINPKFFFNSFILRFTAPYPCWEKEKEYPRYESDLPLVYRMGGKEVESVVLRGGLMSALVHMLSKIEDGKQVVFLKRLVSIITPFHLTTVVLKKDDDAGYTKPVLEYFGILGKLRPICKVIQETMDSLSDEKFTALAGSFRDRGFNPLNKEGVDDLRALFAEAE